MYKKDKNFKLDCTYQVVSIFNNVINLRYQNRIYSIFNQKINKAPYSLIVDDDYFLKLKYSSNKTIFIPNLDVEEFSCYLENHNKLIELSCIENKLKSLNREFGLIEIAFQNRRKDGILKDLLGLGIGLTPSGDDYIVGYMAGYYSQHQGILPEFRLLANLAQSKTNEISANYLNNASNRLFKQEILDMVNNISDEDCINNLLNMGFSSGQDILYGIYDYFKRYDFKQRIGGLI
ncbi:hypothetical protein CEP45_03230 [Mergibacter septicus]|uniref:DUF2877 domain-containing protein n=1 Tax=Mergibacter septicus TaxID=221402 RepID=UPI001C75DD21|nr:DUF2877 domain-containing protein [Mergibacter septicus]QDJ12921.1 hypothetical protein CEP45_03230 [Mergibacter septicus]